MELLANLDLEFLRNIFDAESRGDIITGGIYLMLWRELHGIRTGLASLGLRVDDHGRRLDKVENKQP